MIGNSFDASFQGMQILFYIGFFAVIAIIVVSAVKGMATWSSNEQKPRLRVHASVVAKRTQTSGGNQTMVSTNYYATFEVESGDRMEFRLNGSEYGELAEGDRGMLDFQGTRFQGFTRESENADAQYHD
ncbi:DUF2500 domain-containing protein [Sporolactobacillus sp. STSJ-5]|uniref:DUF2500 domain-containing protein n=1 Tax=Sporolactobacillus sp. STSJ-5 TaxID=2965076 RepID=UPI0021064AD4|nr:DUF2500 domain-containing protein [Sporolactobacillus sp. STSJ-5]MCQ2010297.1 DUF2500 domain-containing protein [Sporolactobacillus sp. STSJ-5]